MIDVIILRSVFGKVGQKYFIQPCPNPRTRVDLQNVLNQLIPMGIWFCQKVTKKNKKKG